MTTQEYIFCEEYYLNGGNATDAATVAEYPNPEQDAKALIERDDIKEEIAQYSEPVEIDPKEAWAMA